MTGLKGRVPEGILQSWEKCDSKKEKATLQHPYYTTKAHQDRRLMWSVVRGHKHFRRSGGNLR